MNEWVADLTSDEKARMKRYSTAPQDYKNLRADHIRAELRVGATVPGVATHANSASFGGGVNVTITGKSWDTIEVAEALKRGVID